MRLMLVVLMLAFAGLLAVDLEPSSLPQAATNVAATPVVRPKPVARTVDVAFVKNGWIARVERTLPRGITPQEYALRELIQGPTRVERRKGIRTAIPDGVRIRSISRTPDTWIASFSRSLLGSGTADTKRTRLWQITATLAPLGLQSRLVLATEGRFVTSVPLGVRPEAWKTDTGENDYVYSVRGVQARLAQLGYMSDSDVSAELDYATEQALLAFQSWEGIDRTGTVTGSTQLALLGARRPRPASRAPGRHVEIYRDRGVVLLVDDGEVVRAVHTSTGSGGRTPAGSFHVYVKSLYSWSVPFKVWMPYAAYFTGGIAMHQSPDVPSYPASHGCVRLPEGEADRVYRFVDVGTPVFVH